MKFIDRREELSRLQALSRRRQAGLAVVYGRRRIGKTRLLLEWAAQTAALYTVSDQSAPEVQRRYLAEAVSAHLSGFSDVEYPDWRTLLSRLAREAQLQRWRGPIILDELPYLVLSSPDFPSVMQRWIDHEAKDARLIVTVAGSSQRMMQGLALSSEAPLFGRANEILEIHPIEPSHLQEAFPGLTRVELIESWASWGGIPRYWELAIDLPESPMSRVERMVLDPLGPLHREPDHLLIEEIPRALEVRPVLDAIGAGAHRVSEIAGRLGRPATSISRPLQRLTEMGLIRREVPFGESEKSRRSLYRIDDPFFRLWFRTVAPHRSALATGSPRSRSQLLKRSWDHLVAEAWESLCRRSIPALRTDNEVGRQGPWGPATRWWKGSSPEWDVVSESLDGKHLLLGEAKWSRRTSRGQTLQRMIRSLASKPPPTLGKRYIDHEVVRVLFVPDLESGHPREVDGIRLLSSTDVLRIEA